MSLLTDVLERLRALVSRRRQERELDEELRFHIEREVEVRRRRGLDPEVARREALIAFGGIERFKEEVRDARGVRPLQDLGADVRYAVRALRRNPIFTVAAVLVLALGIGASATVFSVADAVIFSDLPYPDADRLVRIFNKNSPTNIWSLSTVDVQAIVDRQRSFSAFGALQYGQAALSGAGAPEEIRLGRATSGFYQAIGVPAARGRLVEPRDDVVGAPPVAVVSHAFAARALGGAATAVGRSITIDGVSHTVVGVLPTGIDDLAGARAAAWTALQLRPPTRRGPFGLRGVGRLRDGATLEAATRDLAAISRGIYAQWASGFADSTARLTPVPLRETILGPADRQLGLFGASVALVLLIAIANVAMLMLVRTSAREQELAVRTALGAGRSRLARLLLTEGLVLTAVAGVASLAVTAAGLRAALVLAPNLPRVRDAALDGRVVGIVALAVVMSGILVSLSPVSMVLRRGARVSLGTDARRVGTGRRTNAIRGAFVVAEFALALPLLFGAGLLLNSFVRLSRVDPGVDPKGVVALATGLPRARYPEDTTRERFWQRLEQRASELPGVVAVGLGGSLPPDNFGETNNFDLVDHPVPVGTAEPTSPWINVSEGYFRALGIPLQEGRVFTAADSGEAPPVAVVSRSWAKRYFPGEQALGRPFIEGGCRDCPRTTIVGIVGDVKYQGLANAGEAVYVPATQWSNGRMMLVVRSSASPAATFRVLREVVGGLDAELPLEEMTLTQQLDRSMADPKHWTVVLGAFATSAVVLAALGIFGLMSYIVRQRRREIGVRMALGALPSSVRWMIIGRGMRYAAPGTLIGLGLVLVEARWLSSFLYGVGTTDPPTLAGVVALLLMVAFIACWLPGWRASRIHPAEAVAAD